MRFRPLLLLSALLLASCGQKAEQAPRAEAPADTVSHVDERPAPAPAPGADTALESFDRKLYRHYARLAVNAPHAVIDSIVHSGDMAHARQEVQKYLLRRDTLARKALADYYSMRLDSVNAIIARGNAERW